MIDTRARTAFLEGDIAAARVDAIVNSAGSALRGGGGCDGAIHRAAGPALAVAGTKLAPCPVGEVRVTSGFRLPARLVIHTVAPRSNASTGDREKLLALCFRRSVRAADGFGARSVAIPAIGAGVRGFPPEIVARIAVSECRAQLAACRFVRELYFCLTTRTVKEAFVDAMAGKDPMVPTAALDRGPVHPLGAEFDFRFIYVAIIGMLHHQWAFFARYADKLSVVFVTDTGAVLETREVRSVEQAKRLVRTRRFERWGPESHLSTFISLPWWPPFKPD